MNEPEFTSVVVASGADSAYACPLAVMIRSVLRHAAPSLHIDFQIIDSGLTPEDRRRILRSLDPARSSIRWIAPQRDSLVGLPLWGRMSVATYDKLLLAELLDPSLPRAIWLDADILVLTDISQLWKQPEGDRLALACTDPLVPTVASTFGVAGWKDLQLPPESPYFNAGVLLVNLDAWRTWQVSSRAIDYLRQHYDRVYFWDQEALNATLANRWASIEVAWNSSPDRIPAHTTPHLIHFSGNLKPWRHFGSSRWHQLYYEGLDQTDWAGWRPASRSGRWLGWYQNSPLRSAMRHLEPWAMRAWRRWTLHPNHDDSAQPGVRPGHRHLRHPSSHGGPVAFPTGSPPT